MKSSPKIWWLLPTICLITGLIAVFAVESVMGLGWIAAIKEGTILAVVLALTNASLLFLIFAYPTKVGILPYAIVLGLIGGLTGAWLHGIFSHWALSAVERQQILPMQELLNNDRWLVYPFLLIICSVTLALYRRMDEIESRYARQQDAVTLLKEAELFKLRQQLQPHFLYNSLNAIASLVIAAPSQAGEMIGRLSDFLRSSVRQGKTDLVLLSEELEFLKNYLWIETVRFGERLQVQWSVAEESMLAKMPPFLLQPVMENAIRFGVYGQTGEVVISVRISLESGILSISISNPYDPTMKAAGGTGFGLEGIRRRLYLTYARQDLLQTAEKEGQFSTTILIPQ